jgi:hypothetical protein
VVQWSEFLATDPEARVRFPALPEKKVVRLERGPFSLVSLSPRANYTDRVTAACRRSDCQLLRIEGAMWYA